MHPLSTHDFVISHIGHLENIGSLNYTDRSEGGSRRGRQQGHLPEAEGLTQGAAARDNGGKWPKGLQEGEQPVIQAPGSSSQAPTAPSTATAPGWQETRPQHRGLKGTCQDHRVPVGTVREVTREGLEPSGQGWGDCWPGPPGNIHSLHGPRTVTRHQQSTWHLCALGTWP